MMRMPFTKKFPNKGGEQPTAENEKTGETPTQENLGEGYIMMKLGCDPEDTWPRFVKLILVPSHRPRSQIWTQMDKGRCQVVAIMENQSILENDSRDSKDAS